MGRWLIAIFTLFASLPALASEGRQDPLNSPVWEYMRELFFDGEQVVFDDRVVVTAPKRADDSTQVPISIRAHGLGPVSEILVFIDLNPLPKAARFFPLQAEPYLALRVKVNEATPIRAAARTGDGVWHVGGVYVDAAGGGCIAPPAIAVGPGWADHLGEVQGRSWPLPGGKDRIRTRIKHPMDTGLVDNIPAFYIETLSVTDNEGKLLARLDAFEPVSANPAFTFEVKHSAKGYFLTGRDNNANDIKAFVPPGVLP